MTERCDVRAMRERCRSSSVGSFKAGQRLYEEYAVCVAKLLTKMTEWGIRRFFFFFRQKMSKTFDCYGNSLLFYKKLKERRQDFCG